MWLTAKSKEFDFEIANLYNKNFYAIPNCKRIPYTVNVIITELLQNNSHCNAKKDCFRHNFTINNIYHKKYQY